MIPAHTRVVTISSILLLGSLAGCAALRQNVRGQELSYRGAWHCPSGTCEAKAMVKSTSGTREGTVTINTVNLAPGSGKAGMAFTAAAPFDTLTATVRDCKGQSAEVPAASIVGPGKHGIADANARESWIVWIAAAELGALERGKGACAVWKVEATATWSDGATYSLTAGVDLK